MKKILVSTLFVWGVITVSAYAQTSPIILGSTNRGELVEIDLSAGTAVLIGDAGVFEGREPGWTDIAFDAAGNLFAVSRHRGEIVTTCFGGFSNGECAHLYQINPVTGAIIREIGDLGINLVSDMDFAADCSLFACRLHDVRGLIEEGGIFTIDPGDATTTIPANDRFGFGDPGFELTSGGFSVHPVTGELWVVEAASSNGRLFRVDPATGLAISPVLQTGLDGVPGPPFLTFDGLEILPDGTFIATRAKGGSGGTPHNEVYEINPVADPISGLAEVTLIPLAIDPAITGALNGLAVLPSATVVIDSCDSFVENVLLDDGCNIFGLIAKCAENAENHGQFVSCVSHVTNGLKKDGIISGMEMGKIVSCAARSDIP